MSLLAMLNGWCRMHRDLRPALRREARQRMNSMIYEIVWVRLASLFFKAFQNGCPNRKELHWDPSDGVA